MTTDTEDVCTCVDNDCESKAENNYCDGQCGCDKCHFDHIDAIAEMTSLHTSSEDD